MITCHECEQNHAIFLHGCRHAAGFGMSLKIEAHYFIEYCNRNR